MRAFGLRWEGDDIYIGFQGGVEDLLGSVPIDNDVFRAQSFDRFVDEALEACTVIGPYQVSGGPHGDACFGWETIE